MQNLSPNGAIEQYIQTGEYDPLYFCFEGQHHLERIRNGRQTLHNALISVLRSLASSVSARQPNGLPTDLRLFTREKVDAMVRGLFKRAEVETVLDSLENSVVFLTPDTIEETLLMFPRRVILRSLGARYFWILWLSEGPRSALESNERRASLVHKCRSIAISRSESRQ